MTEKREAILGIVSDAVLDLLYYDRKECDIFPVDAIEQHIKDGVITVDDMVNKFRDNIQECYDNYNESRSNQEQS